MNLKLVCYPKKWVHILDSRKSYKSLKFEKKKDSDILQLQAIYICWKSMM